MNLSETFKISEKEGNLIVTELKWIFWDRINWILENKNILDNLLWLIYDQREKVLTMLEKTKYAVSNHNNLIEIRINFFEYLKDKYNLKITYDELLIMPN